MNKEFKRMQQLAGLVVESLNFDGNAELEKIVPEKADYVRDEVNALISENGAQMYDGLLAVVDELANDDNWWNARYREIKDEWEDEDDQFIGMVLDDDFDRELMRRYGKKFYDN